MELAINLNSNTVELKILRNRKTIDFETAKYYHDLDDVLTPLEVSAIRKKGVIIKHGQAIYGELLTGLISTLDKLLKRNKIDAIALKTFKINGNLGADSTSYKIASAFIQGLKI